MRKINQITYIIVILASYFVGYMTGTTSTQNNSVDYSMHTIPPKIQRDIIQDTLFLDSSIIMKNSNHYFKGTLYVDSLVVYDIVEYK